MWRVCQISVDVRHTWFELSQSLEAMHYSFTNVNRRIVKLLDNREMREISIDLQSHGRKTHCSIT